MGTLTLKKLGNKVAVVNDEGDPVCLLLEAEAKRLGLPLEEVS